MNRWSVTGANERTGADASIIVDASTEDEAIRVAKARGILVSAVSKLPPPPTVNYASKSESSAEAEPPICPPTAEYDVVRKAADRLTSIAAIIVVAGMIVFVLMILGAVLPAMGVTRIDVPLEWLILMGVGGVIVLAVGLALNMLAMIGELLADIATILRLK